MSARESEKRAAAAAAADLVQDGMRLGLGSGSTTAIFLRLLAEKVQQGLNVCGVPTSSATEQLALSCGIPLTTLNETPQLDLTIDGADEVDPNLCLIKGGGGALLREKLVAASSREVVIIVDSGKIKPQLGGFPLPVEVTQFAWKPVAHFLRAGKFGGNGHPHIRETGQTRVELRQHDGRPFVTDEGNFILDCHLHWIDDPAAINDRLNGVVGVIEHGLFVGLADQIIVAAGEQTKTLRRPKG